MTVTMSSEGENTKNLNTEVVKNDKNNSDIVDDKKNIDKINENNSKVSDKDKTKNETDNGEKDNEETTKNNIENDNKPKEEEDEVTEESEKVDEEEDSEKDPESKETSTPEKSIEKPIRRQGKNVQRTVEEPEKLKVEISGGAGTPLGSIPRIDASISRFKNDDMKLLHSILFQTPGKATVIKKNIKKFNGFHFKRDSDEHKKKITSLQKFEVKQLKSVCEMLDLQKNGSKDDIIERIIDFLMEPKDSGKNVGGGRPKRTAAVKANNRGYSSHDNYSSDERHSGRYSRDKGKRLSLREDSSSQSDEDFQPSDESDEKPRKRNRVSRRKPQSDEEEEDSEELEESSSADDDSDFQEEPKSKRKKPTKANNKTKGKTPSRRGRKPGSGAAGRRSNAPKKHYKGSTDEEEEDEESDHKEKGESSSSEDEPLSKKAKSTQPPSDDEIKRYVKEILEGANLEQITMKTVCQQVYAHYPDFDLAHKKDFIKTTVKSLIST